MKSIPTSDAFTEAFKTWFDSASAMVKEHLHKNYTAPNLLEEHLVYESGKRYIRICRAQKDSRARSAFAFIDKTNGDVLKPASWKIPAKHARGNIFDENNGMGSMTPYGPAYLRG